MSNVTVLANGRPLDGWLEVNIERHFDKMTGQGTVQFSEQPGQPVPMRLGDVCQMLIDSTPVITGHVHEFFGEHDHHRHDMRCVVRDKTQDIIDSTVGPNLRLKSPISLKQLAERALRTAGLSGIGVVDNVNPEQFRDGEVISASIDDKIFHVLDQWAQKRQVLFRTDGKGNLVIDRNRKTRAPGGARLIKLFEDSPVNNVLKAGFRNSDLNRHNQTHVAGQKSPNDKDYWEGKPKSEPGGQAGKMQKGWGTAQDGEVRGQRKMHARGVKGLAGSSPQKAAKWRSSAARKKGFQYTATVQGFYGAPGWLWQPGFLVPVTDMHFELSAELLIVDVRYHKTWQGGETCEVALTLPDAYTTDAAGSKAAARTSRYGTGSVDPGRYDIPEDAL